MNNNHKIAVFPGSFDPITLGHCDIVFSALRLFDKIIIAIGDNSKKKSMFSIEKRKIWIYKTFLNKCSKIEVDSFNGLTISFCIKKKVKFLLRGIRNHLDFEFEKEMFFFNKKLNKNSKIETICIFSSYDNFFIRSSMVRDVMKKGGNYTVFVPQSVRI
ncbi:pantetheine-phosphate adenylyltransferase [Blattabacterium cuenoti]|uniref:pantetheine-phosphate adenylyltransferase n=1 Tax=Blattabacterium cuenoti TaxID=1653831 RepID=UPI00163C014E|nr:pantetheine-phosphate adenylyltransferase [Blattabacterium cuenoti]